MKLILTIAWRNILRHRGKSLIIGAILFLGALIMTIGNGVISGMDAGLAQTVVHGFTGDVVLISNKQEGDNAFLEMMGKAVEPIYNFPAVREALAGVDCISHAVPAGKNMALVLNEDGGTPGFAYLLGVDWLRYQEAFPDNADVIEGRLPRPGEAAALIPRDARKEMYNYANIWFTPDSVHSANLTDEARTYRASLSVKTSVVFMGANADNSTTDMRLPVAGVLRYKAHNHIWGHFVIVDIESYRRCLGYFAVADRTVELSPERKALLEMDGADLDNMFGDEVVVANPAAAAPAAQAPTTAAAAAPAVDIDAGAYNMVLVLLRDGVTPEQGAKRINAALAGRDLGVRAVTWQKAIGPLGSIAVLIKSALFVFVMFLFFVAIVVIINTLTMSAIERTPEIGMMRAVGARKGFITLMFLGETGVLSFVFGGAGILAGIVAVNVLAALNLTSSNDIVQLLYGGDTFHPLLTLSDVGLAVLQLAVVTVLAAIYPATVARAITPLDAVTRE